MHGRDQTVAPKRRGVPGDPGIGVAAIGGRRHKNAEIRERLADDVIDDRIRRIERYDRAVVTEKVAPRLRKPAKERWDFFVAAFTAGHRDDLLAYHPWGKRSSYLAELVVSSVGGGSKINAVSRTFSSSPV